MFMCRKRDRTRIRLTAGLTLLALGTLSVSARAGDDAPAAPGAVENLSRKIESFHASQIPAARTIAKKLGMATDPGEPADFVVKSRPVDEQNFIPIGRKETDQPIKAKTPAELKAMEADFDKVKARHDALRSTFAPAVKAVAEAQAAKAAKAEKKQHPAATPAEAH